MVCPSYLSTRRLRGHARSAWDLRVHLVGLESLPMGHWPRAAAFPIPSWQIAKMFSFSLSLSLGVRTVRNKINRERDRDRERRKEGRGRRNAKLSSLFSFFFFSFFLSFFSSCSSYLRTSCTPPWSNSLAPRSQDDATQSLQPRSERALSLSLFLLC